jgi:hypothetical protein
MTDYPEDGVNRSRYTPEKTVEAFKYIHRQVGNISLNASGIAEWGMLISHMHTPKGLSEGGMIVGLVTPGLHWGIESVVHKPVNTYFS